MSRERGPRYHRGPQARTQLATAGIALAALIFGAMLLPATIGAEDPRPNVIVIVADDQPVGSVPHVPVLMPYLQDRILDPSDHWVVFPNGFVNSPMCCPSRAAMLTGRYPHRTGVQDNSDGHRIDETATLAAWLDAGGYLTGLVGKYLNGYPFDGGPLVPQGWDRWWGKQQGDAGSVYYDFTLIEQGMPVHYGSDPSDYATDVLASKAYRFIHDAPADRPFFLWFAPTAPHPPWLPAPRDEGEYEGLVVPSPPSVGEPDVSDKPAWVQALLPFDVARFAEIREDRRRSYETLRALDDAVRGIVDEVRARGELGETIIVYTSDNGFSFGEHRWAGKGCGYDPCLRVPFLVRVPGVAHRVEAAIVSAVDLAPTIAELAGVEPTVPVDGVSLVPLLRTSDRSNLRGAVFAEWVGDETIPGWWELRTARFAYVELGTGERELYALFHDPYELVNVVDDPRFTPDVERLAAALAAQREG